MIRRPVVETILCKYPVVVKLISVAAIAFAAEAKTCAVTPGITAPRYRVVDIHDLEPEETTSVGARINSSGHVLGTWERPGGREQGFFWTPVSGMQLLQALEPQARTFIADFNNLDQIVGYSDARPVIWENPSAMPIDMKSAIDTRLTSVNSINEHQYMVVELFEQRVRLDAIYSETTGLVLPDPPDADGAQVDLWGISNDNIAYGTIRFADGPVPLLWNLETDSYELLPLPTIDVFAAQGLEIDESDAARVAGINDRGDVLLSVGALGNVTGNLGVMRFADGTEVSLGFLALPSSVSGDAFATVAAGSMNNFGQVIGSTDVVVQLPIDIDVFDVPFIWDRVNGARAMIDLLDESSAGWNITGLADINDDGVVVGWGRREGGGRTHAILFIPVPEPTGLVTFSIGALLLLGAWRQKSPLLI